MKNNDLIYDWLDFMALQKSHKKTISEDKIKDFVSGRNIAVAKDIGVYDADFSSTHGDFISLDPSWISSNIVNVNLINGGKAQFHKKYADRLQKAFEAACKATGWTPENPSKGYCPKPNGGFVQRRSRAPSESVKPVEQRQIGGHAWGTSIDLGSAQENPMGGGGKIRQYPEFINAMKQNGFIWGGDWSNKDDMHFEVNIDGSAVPTEASGTDTSMLDTEDSSDSFYSLIPSLTKIFSLKEGKDNKEIFSINDESKDHLYKKYQKYFDSLLKFLRKELKLTKPVKINLLHDEKNSKKILGKTGSYINHREEIVIYTTGRHIKDIMRSLSHELVHHRQNIRGEFENHEPTKNGYAQSNKHLRNMEKEAYLKGNILFRDWEDNYKYRGEKQ
jgi:hypothetical protein